MNRRPTECMPDRRHKFAPDSGWCLHGCGNRDDGRTTLVSGKEIVPGPTYTPEDIATMYAQLTERTA